MSNDRRAVLMTAEVLRQARRDANRIRVESVRALLRRIGRAMARRAPARSDAPAGPTGRRLSEGLTRF